MNRIIENTIFMTIKESLEGYKRLNKLCYKNLFVFSKHLDDIYYSYIIFRLNQTITKNYTISVSLWVGPIDRPDDGLYSLSANIELIILKDCPYNDSLIEDCCNRIKNIISANIFSNLIIFSKKELFTPSYGVGRNHVYTNFFLPIFRLTIKECQDKNVLRDKKKIAPVITDLYDCLNKEQRSFFRKMGKNGIVDKIWELCYIYSMNN